MGNSIFSFGFARVSEVRHMLSRISTKAQLQHNFRIFNLLLHVLLPKKGILKVYSVSKKNTLLITTSVKKYGHECSES